MSNLRIANLKKKSPKNSPAVHIVYLYYAEDCEFCKELIRILIVVPDLAKMIKCINVNEYEVDNMIDAIPTIDEGTDEDDEKVLHKLEGAFSWVIHQCYSLLDVGTLRPEEVAKVEQRVKKVFRALEVQMHGGQVRDHELMREDKMENPRDEYQSHAENSENFSKFDYSGQHKSKDLYRKYLKESEHKPRPKGSVTDRMKSWERERQAQLNKFKRKWEKDGGVKELKTIKREALKSTKNISELQIKNWENERLRMLDGITSRHTGTIREPIKRQSIKMGTSVSDKDIHTYERQRQQMVERIRARNG